MKIKSDSAKGTEMAGSDNWPNFIAHEILLYTITILYK